MLYYRLRKTETVRIMFAKIITSLLIMITWSLWFLHELPLMSGLSDNLFGVNSEEIKNTILLSVPAVPTNPTNEVPLFTEPAIGVLTSPFGERWGRLHKGIDIGGTHGSDVFAAGDGTVILSQWVDGYGNYIEIEHPNGYQSIYGHCHQLLVSPGDIVEKGQVIATMGNTGNSTGPHLHFEILHNGEPQNPLHYVIY